MSVAALVLAAGLSRRMGGRNKLLLKRNGETLIQRAVAAVLGSRARPVIVVTGHEADRVETALAGLPVLFVRAGQYADGMSQSLAAGIGAVPPEAEGVLIALGDMPGLSGADIDRLLAAFDAAPRPAILVPVFHGRRGHPVLFDRRYRAELTALSGDWGARPVLARHHRRIVEVPFTHDGILRDIDRPEDLG